MNFKSGLAVVFPMPLKARDVWLARRDKAAFRKVRDSGITAQWLRIMISRK
jgi:hypothetical protein